MQNSHVIYKHDEVFNYVSGQTFSASHGGLQDTAANYNITRQKHQL